MATTIGALNAFLGMNSAAFVSDVQKARAALGTFRASANRDLAGFDTAITRAGVNVGKFANHLVSIRNLLGGLGIAATARGLAEFGKQSLDFVASLDAAQRAKYGVTLQFQNQIKEASAATTEAWSEFEVAFAKVAFVFEASFVGWVKLIDLATGAVERLVGAGQKIRSTFDGPADFANESFPAWQALPGPRDVLKPGVNPFAFGPGTAITREGYVVPAPLSPHQKYMQDLEMTNWVNTIRANPNPLDAERTRLSEGALSPVNVSGALAAAASSPVKVMMDEIRTNKNAFRSAVADFTNIWGDAFDQIHDSAVNTFMALEDAIVRFVQTGKFNIGQFVSYALAEFARIGIHKLLSLGADVLFGGGGGGAAGDAVDQTLIDTGAAVFGRASGGPVKRSHPYIVGEQGPELFIPNTSGSIVPNGMGGHYTIVNHIDARGAQEGVADQIVKAMKAAAPAIIGASVKAAGQALPQQLRRVQRDDL